jgi:hypothetical protein
MAFLFRLGYSLFINSKRIYMTNSITKQFDLALEAQAHLEEHALRYEPFIKSGDKADGCVEALKDYYYAKQEQHINAQNTTFQTHTPEFMALMDLITEVVFSAPIFMEHFNLTQSQYASASHVVIAELKDVVSA